MTRTMDEIMQNGLWPKVVSVCTFKNTDTPESSVNEIVEIYSHCSKFDCQNISIFVDIMRFDERAFGSGVSYYFVLLPHFVNLDEFVPEPHEKAAYLQPDLLIGSRCEKPRAIDWLLDFFRSSETGDLQEIAFIDKIFGNAVSTMSKPGRCVDGKTVSNMTRGLIRIEEIPLGTAQ